MTTSVQVTANPTVVLEAVNIETGTRRLLLTTPITPDERYPALMELAESAGWVWGDWAHVLRPDWRERYRRRG